MELARPGRFHGQIWTRKNPDASSIHSSVISFYEGIGVLLKRKLIDKTLVDDLMSSSITMLWEKMEPLIRERKERANWPQIAEWFEYLYNEIKPIVEEQHPELKT